MTSQTLTAAERSSAPSPVRIIAVALTLLAPLLIYAGTLQSMVGIWNSSETFTHQYCILPISLWLIWRRRAVLARMTPAPWWPALLLLLACGAAWLMGVLAGVQVVRQYAVVSMMILVVPALFGRRIAWAIAFPLLFLLLAVPFGEIFIDPLINFTADFTVAALRATGIPVLREGNSFVIPSGRWSVIEACSGVRYLIASVTLGLLYAHLTYRSRKRQIAFMIVSIVVPIIANGLRAYMIVMIGHLSGMALAVGVDHIIYGWLFFGLVMFLLFWMGGFWHEAESAEDIAAAGVRTSLFATGTPGLAAVPGRTLSAMIAGVLICICIWPLYGDYMARADANPAPPRLDQLQRLSSQWPETAPFTTWRPDYTTAAAELYRNFSNGAHTAGMALLYYRNQHAASTLIGTLNRLLPEKNSPWVRLSTDRHQVTAAGRQITVREEALQNIQRPGEGLLVWRCYWIDGTFTDNDYLGKLLLTKEKLLMRGDDGVALFLYAPYTDNPAQARTSLQSFVDANLPAVEAVFDSNRKR
jgi:exosortase A